MKREIVISSAFFQVAESSVGSIILASLFFNPIRGSVCSNSLPQACDSDDACSGVSGVWVPVVNATYIPGTALVGGRRYTLEQSDSEFTQTVSAPNGGYCTSAVTAPSAACEGNATLCESMDACFYRQAGAGRWFHSVSSETCMPTCAHPLVFCDKSNCQSTMGCDWFVKTQSNADECYCIDNPGLFGNPPAKPRVTWIFWDQPWSIPIFVFACIAGVAVLYNVWIFNLKPFFRRALDKRRKS